MHKPTPSAGTPATYRLPAPSVPREGSRDPEVYKLTSLTEEQGKDTTI